MLKLIKELIGKLIDLRVEIHNGSVSDEAIIASYKDCMKFIEVLSSPDGKLSEYSILGAYPFIAKLNIIIPEMQKRGIYKDQLCSR